MKHLKRTAWFTLIGTAIFSSVYFSDFPGGMDFPPLLTMKSTRRENHSGMGRESNKRKVKNEKGFWQIQLDIDRSGIYSAGTPCERRVKLEKQRWDIWALAGFACGSDPTTEREERRSDNDFTPEILPVGKRAMGSGIDVTLREKSRENSFELQMLW